MRLQRVDPRPPKWTGIDLQLLQCGRCGCNVQALNALIDEFNHLQLLQRGRCGCNQQGSETWFTGVQYLQLLQRGRCGCNNASAYPFTTEDSASNCCNAADAAATEAHAIFEAPTEHLQLLQRGRCGCNPGSISH